MYTVFVIFPRATVCFFKRWVLGEVNYSAVYFLTLILKIAKTMKLHNHIFSVILQDFPVCNIPLCNFKLLNSAFPDSDKSLVRVSTPFSNRITHC